jgi:F-type H+-transporting ATPase subunit epsilon
MRVTVVSPERAVFDGEATSLVAPAYDGLVGILPGHAPFVTLLGDGVLTLRQGAGGAEPARYRVSGGFLQVVGGAQDAVRVVADSVADFS